MTLFFFVETDSSGEMLLSVFYSFSIHATSMKP